MSAPSRLLALLEDQPSQSAIELRQATGLGERHVSAALARLKNLLRYIHISGWRRDEDGGRLYVRALYSVGSKRDASKPPPLTRADYTRRYRARTTVVPSIFHLGAPIDSRRITALRQPKGAR